MFCIRHKWRTNCLTGLFKTLHRNVWHPRLPLSCENELDLAILMARTMDVCEEEHRKHSLVLESGSFPVLKSWLLQRLIGSARTVVWLLPFKFAGPCEVERACSTIFPFAALPQILDQGCSQKPSALHSFAILHQKAHNIHRSWLPSQERRRFRWYFDWIHRVFFFLFIFHLGLVCVSGSLTGFRFFICEPTGLPIARGSPKIPTHAQIL